MTKFSEKMLHVLNTAETRRGFKSWFGHEFKRMIENGIDDYGWSDEVAEAKAHEAARICLAPIISTDPPVVHIKVHNSIVTVSLHWPESRAEH